MKITSSQADPAFKPITLSITLESQDEVDAIKTMTGYDESIPEWFNDNCVRVKKPLLKAFLYGIFSRL